MKSKPKDVLAIRISDDDCVKVDYLVEGHVFHKTISASGILEALRQSSYTRSVVRSGYLPKGCISYSHETESGISYFVIEHTERKADIFYHDTAYKDFPLPRLVFGFRVSGDGKVQSAGVAVVEDGCELNEDTPIYLYPFSNVAGFGICTGSNKLPVYKKISALKNLPNFILSLPNNDDHFKESHNKPGLGYRDLLELLKDKPPEYYYTDILVKSKHTLKNFA